MARLILLIGTFWKWSERFEAERLISSIGSHNWALVKLFGWLIYESSEYEFGRIPCKKSLALNVLFRRFPMATVSIRFEAWTFVRTFPVITLLNLPIHLSWVQVLYATIGPILDIVHPIWTSWCWMGWKTATDNWHLLIFLLQ